MASLNRRFLPRLVVLRLRGFSLTLQRHFSVLTKFSHVESRLSGRKRQREEVFLPPVNLCDRRACSASVAVGLMFGIIPALKISFRLCLESKPPSRLT